ncbi:hypothetical protein U3516DRAFT_751516 [Neocallimastix sp. 'constans']
MIIIFITTVIYCAKFLNKLELSVKNKYGENITSFTIKLGLFSHESIIRKRIQASLMKSIIKNENTLIVVSKINNYDTMNNINLKNNEGKSLLNLADNLDYKSSSNENLLKKEIYNIDGNSKID